MQTFPFCMKVWLTRLWKCVAIELVQSCHDKFRLPLIIGGVECHKLRCFVTYKLEHCSLNYMYFSCTNENTIFP